MLGILDAIEDAFARGDRRMDLGPGAQPYKLRFADGNAPLGVVGAGPARPQHAARARADAADDDVARAAHAAKRALPPERADRLRALRDRVR